MMPFERSFETSIHGRYLVQAAERGLPMLAGFHGYAESADIDLKRLTAIEGSEGWIVVAVQGLHRFYRGRSNDVVASWMTSQDRELAIADNKAYTSRVIEAVAQEWSARDRLVLAGFSQGVAMAFRCATSIQRAVTAVVALGGDVPPELEPVALSRIPAVLLARGDRDEWYTEEKLAADERRLRAAGVKVTIARFDAGHEWTPEFSSIVAGFLRASPIP